MTGLGRRLPIRTRLALLYTALLAAALAAFGIGARLRVRGGRLMAAASLSAVMDGLAAAVLSYGLPPT